MTVDIKTVVYIIVGLLTIGGAVGGFFQMQTRQNMKIDQLEKEQKELKDELARVKNLATDHDHPKLEQAIALLSLKMDQMSETLQELKAVVVNIAGGK